MTYTYAIGDIHGMRGALNELLAKIFDWNNFQPNSKSPKFVFVGDYIDRGPDSKGVVDDLLKLSEDYNCVFLKGNHEDMLLNDLSLCLGNGGRATFKSYGWNDSTDYIMENPVRPSLSMIPKEHLDFYKNLKLMHRDGLRTFVHAGIDRSRSLDDQVTSVLLWVRGPFLYNNMEEGGYVVHGHTPMENGRFPAEKENRVNIDTGAVFDGMLTCAVFNDTQVKPIHFIQVRGQKEGPL